MQLAKLRAYVDGGTEHCRGRWDYSTGSTGGCSVSRDDVKLPTSTPSLSREPRQPPNQLPLRYVEWEPRHIGGQHALARGPQALSRSSARSRGPTEAKYCGECVPVCVYYGAGRRRRVHHTGLRCSGLPAPAPRTRLLSRLKGNVTRRYVRHYRCRRQAPLQSAVATHPAGSMAAAAATQGELSAEPRRGLPSPCYGVRHIVACIRRRACCTRYAHQLPANCCLARRATASTGGAEPAPVAVTRS